MLPLAALMGYDFASHAIAPPVHPDAELTATPSVAELMLWGLNLTGMLPAAPLALLRCLRVLDLSTNALSWKLPVPAPSCAAHLA